MRPTAIVVLRIISFILLLLVAGEQGVRSIKRDILSQELLIRYKSLISDIENIGTVEQSFGPARLKPLFTRYNSCEKEFKELYPEKYEKLNLERLPLYDEEGKERFINEKVSTLLHQSKELFSVLQAQTPPQGELESPSKVTLKWLWTNVPISLWIALLGIFLLIFLFGAYCGRQEWFDSLFDFLKNFKEMKG